MTSSNRNFGVGRFCFIDMNNELAKLIPNDISKITVITLLELLMKFGTPKEDIRIALSIIQGVHSASQHNVDAFLLRYSSEIHVENLLSPQP